MPRRRFAVALLITPPASIEIDGLRRALGDRQLGRIDPHITVIPPINLHDDELTDALTVVQAAAARAEVMTLELGPVTTFSPSSPVRFLAVEPWAPVVALYDACRQGVLERPEKRPFHPHVTIDIEGGVIDAQDPAVALLAGYRVEVDVDRVTVLEHVEVHDGPVRRRWEPYIAYRFGLG